MLTLHNAKIVFPRKDLGTLVLCVDRPKVMQLLWVMIRLRWVGWCVGGSVGGGPVKWISNYQLGGYPTNN